MRRQRGLKRLTLAKPLNGFMRTQPEQLQLLRGSSWSIIIIFIIATLIITSLNAKHMNTSNYSLMWKSKFSWTGWTTKVQQASPLASSPSNTNWRRSSGLDQASNGSPNSLLGTQQSTLVNLLDLIPSVLSVSIKETSISILMSWRRFWRRKVYHGVMSTIWMRKVVSKVEGEGCNQSNPSYLTHVDPTISFVAETCSSWQSLSVSVQMALSSHLALSFQVSNSMKSGFLISLKAFGKSHQCRIN